MVSGGFGPLAKIKKYKVEELVNKIENTDLILNHFGYWPAFHDAEVVSLHFDRNFKEGLPRLLIRIYAFEITDKVEAGYYQRIKHCLIQFEFEGVVESEVDGFNHQNAVYGIEFGIEGSLLTCTLDPAYGIKGFTSAHKIKVKNLEKLTKDPKEE